MSLMIAGAARAGSAPGDWPHWRGPTHDGLSAETGFARQWPAGGPALAWKTRGIGAGYGNVAVVGERIFVQGDADGSTCLFALNRADGKRVWAAKLGTPGAPGWGGFAGPRGTPAVDNDLVFAVGQFGQVGCFEAAGGKPVWQKDYAKDFGGTRPEWGFAASPLVEGQKLILAPGGDGGNLVALDKKDGALIWRSKDYTDNPHYATPVPVEMGGVRQYVQLTEKSLAGIAADDGRLLWKAPRKGATAVIPDPIYFEGRVYVTSGYGIGCNLFKLTVEGTSITANQVYANKVMVNHHGGVVRLGDYVYGYSDSKGWTCQNFATGAALWQEKNKLGKGAIAAVDGRLILREENPGKGRVALIEASPAGYRELGQFTPPEQSGKNNWPYPVVAGGLLFLRDQDLLLCYDLRARAVAQALAFPLWAWYSPAGQPAPSVK
jgi:outer membrane protein assembly factor BamB